VTFNSLFGYEWGIDEITIYKFFQNMIKMKLKYRKWLYIQYFSSIEKLLFYSEFNGMIFGWLCRVVGGDLAQCLTVDIICAFAGRPGSVLG